jgi:hypothetical protein
MLSSSILEVGVDATEGEMLAAIVASFLEGVVVETPIVAVVVLDADAVLGGEGLKGLLGCNSFDGRVVDLKMDKS